VIAPVGRIEHFPQAIVANGNIRGDQGGHGRVPAAGGDAKIREVANRFEMAGNLDDVGQRRAFLDEIFFKQADACGRPLDENRHPEDVLATSPFNP